MMLYSDLIDSAIIYHGNDHLIIRRSNSQYMNMSYLEKELVLEPFVQRIREERGGYVPIGIHQERLLSPHGEPVVSVGRAILDPYTKKDLGFILLNISVDKLNTLWRDSSMTENTNFYLIDEDNRIIYSKDRNGIGQPASKLLGNSGSACSSSPMSMPGSRERPAFRRNTRSRRETARASRSCCCRTTAASFRSIMTGTGKSP
ncbi:cache domain-containing protein [Paenibacillus dendritiformis]|uniref:cache domain-containing protein n=1 Tax=Paenibacillus dendritiformis TaxID=130049 RepID=UPI001F557C97|nr:cache domain-containing protein [Paenibacillus dendritiformis]